MVQWIVSAERKVGRKAVASPRAIVALISFLGVLGPSEILAAPSITWRPSSLSEEVAVGNTKTLELELTSSESLSGVSLRVVPELQPLVNVSPATLSLTAGESRTVTLTIVASQVGTFRGTVHVTDGRTIARPLPVTVTVINTPSQTSTVSPNGTTVVLPGFASVLFPPLSFLSDNNVSLTVTSQTQIDEDFRNSTVGRNLGPRLGYEITIDTGTVRPNAPIRVVIPVPASFLASLPADFRLKIYARIVQGGDDELIDSFEPLVTTFDSATNEAEAWLPTHAFSNLLNSAGTYQAILILADPPANIQADANICGTEAWGPPLTGNLAINSPFSPTPTETRDRPHLGTDYAANNGDAVHPVRAGTIVALDAPPDKETTFTVDGTQLKKSGWGQRVIVRHDDGSTTLYAHLQLNSPTSLGLKLGDHVGPLDTIGLADSTGGVTGSHLHLEYRPREQLSPLGEVGAPAGTPIDPDFCVKNQIVKLNSFTAPGSASSEGNGYSATANVTCSASCTVTVSTFGTDGFTDSTSCTLNGETADCSLFVPAGEAGVLDVVKAVVNGITSQRVVVFN